MSGLLRGVRYAIFNSCRRRSTSIASLCWSVGSICCELSGSGEVTNGPLLLAAARTGRQVILSTGMATLEEIETALAVLAFGFSAGTNAPGGTAFKTSYADAGARKKLAEKVTFFIARQPIRRRSRTRTCAHLIRFATRLDCRLDTLIIPWAS